MMRSRRSRWLSGIGAVVFIGGLVLANYGSGVTPAEATDTFVNPFPIIIEKLNQILAKLSNSGGGGGNHTLRWDSNNPSATRFTTAFTGAVLDKNTGLVWEQAPQDILRDWRGAAERCVNKEVGGTVGWRLPSVAELASLIDPSLPAPFVPASAFTIGGTPGVQSALYWSASTPAGFPTRAWFVSFNNGSVFNDISGPIRAWCVRGPMQGSMY